MKDNTKKQMNWGVRIFLTLSIFMVGFVLVGIYMVTKNTDTLEYDDYYERSLNYDEVYARRQNLQQMGAKPGISIDADTMSIRFVLKGNAGHIYLKRSSDASKDRKIPFSVAGEVFQLPVDSLVRGVWGVTLEWKSGQHAFQYEEQIFLNGRSGR